MCPGSPLRGSSSVQLSGGPKNVAFSEAFGLAEGFFAGIAEILTLIESWGFL